MKIELKPCPFCGNKVVPVWLHNKEELRFEGEEGEVLSYFKCYKCAMNTWFDLPLAEEDKIKLWNSRS